VDDDSKETTDEALDKINVKKIISLIEHSWPADSFMMMM
jgi:hypothetical protein